MTARAQAIVAIVAVEAAIVGLMVMSLTGVQPAQWFAPSARTAAAAPGSLVEGGAHRIFEAGSHPALTVDIGYADLTIRTGDSSRFDVALSKDTRFGFLLNKDPITATKDGDTIRIEKIRQRGMSMGDMRRVTVIVPPETQVTVVNAGDIEASGLRATASFDSVGNGSITVDDFNAPALHVEASNGRITLRRIVATRLEATNGNGRVEGTALQVRDGSVETSNGRVRLGFARGADTLVTAETSNGSVRVSDGDQGDRPSSRTVRIGAGNGHLDVHSSNGSIYISQEV